MLLVTNYSFFVKSTSYHISNYCHSRICKFIFFLIPLDVEADKITEDDYPETTLMYTRHTVSNMV